jgi:hypothetical protein
MALPSTIERLPADILAKLQQLLQDPRVTQLDATARINEILEAEGHPDRVSKSAVNRYAVRMEEVGQRLRQSREVAQMYISHVGAAPQGQTGLLINEMLRSMAFELSLKMQDADLEDTATMSATIGQIKNLALTMQRLEQSATINVKRETDIRKHEREKALQDATDAIKEATSKAPVGDNFQFDPKTIDYVTTVLYGLRPK